MVISPQTLATGKKGVFAGGDAVTGPATVIEAISSGKKAALFIDAFLRGEERPRKPLAQKLSTLVRSSTVPKSTRHFLFEPSESKKHAAELTGRYQWEMSVKH